MTIIMQLFIDFSVSTVHTVGLIIVRGDPKIIVNDESTVAKVFSGQSSIVDEVLSR